MHWATLARSSSCANPNHWFKGVATPPNNLAQSHRRTALAALPLDAGKGARSRIIRFSRDEGDTLCCDGLLMGRLMTLVPVAPSRLAFGNPRPE